MVSTLLSFNFVLKCGSRSSFEPTKIKSTIRAGRSYLRPRAIIQVEPSNHAMQQAMDGLEEREYRDR